VTPTESPTPTPAETPTPTPTPPPLDTDGDGYTDLEEIAIGTLPTERCGANWPSNLDNTGSSENKLDIFDLTSFLAPMRRLDSSPPDDPQFNIRWDLKPGSGIFSEEINIQDITTLTSGTTGNPPMFGNMYAFGKTCQPTP
jgi:thrombospondin type 3 repeat protein